MKSIAQILVVLLIGAAPASPADRLVVVGADDSVWGWPLAGEPAVVRAFDPPPRPWLAGHRGVDLAADEGAPVFAADAGVVRFAGIVVNRPVVSIAHADGLVTTYEPVTALVEEGDPVAAGQPIGWLVAGHAGCPAAACLHWGLRLGEIYLDPLVLLGLGRVRLLPAAGRAASRRADRIRPRCCRSAR